MKDTLMKKKRRIAIASSMLLLTILTSACSQQTIKANGKVPLRMENKTEAQSIQDSTNADNKVDAVAGAK